MSNRKMRHEVFILLWRVNDSMKLNNALNNKSENLAGK